MSISSCHKSSINEFECNTCNIILITIDTLRADHLGCYGYERNTSPTIDHIAKESYIFRTAISPKPSTVPGIFSLFTGLEPFYVENGYTIESYGNTIPQIMKNSGYKTIGIVGTNILSRYYGFDKGFDIFHDTEDLPTHKNYYMVNASVLVEKAIEAIEQGKKQHLFLWIHFKEPHARYDPPDKYKQMFIDYGNEVIQIPKVNPDASDGIGGVSSFDYLDNSTNLLYYISQYDSEIRYCDDQIGLLINKLKEQDMYNDSLIVIASDHGESLGENEYYFGHGDFLDSANVDIPLLIKIPGQKEKKEIDDLVVLADLYGFFNNFIGQENLDIKYDLMNLLKNKNWPERTIKLENTHTNLKVEKIFGIMNKSKRHILVDITNETYYYDFTISDEKQHIIGNENIVNELVQTRVNIKQIQDNRKEQYLDKETIKRLQSLGYLNLKND